LRVELLQLAHGLEAQGRGRVVQAQQIGAEIHHHAARRRVASGHAGKEAAKERRHGAGKQLYHPGALADFHDAQPQAHHAHQAQRDIEAGPGGIKQGREHLAKNGHLALGGLHQGGHKAQQNEAGPDRVEHHGARWAAAQRSWAPKKAMLRS
jgi:hypothetical protein